MIASTLLGEEVLQGGQQVGAKAAFLPARAGDQIHINGVQEERLSEILCFLGAATATSQVGVQGIPIGLAERFERRPCLRFIPVPSACPQHDTPLGRAKPGGVCGADRSLVVLVRHA